MVNVSTVTAVWNGFQGAPGYSRFNFAELTSPANVQTAVNAVRTFFDGIKAHLVTTWSINVQPVVQHRDLATGVMTGEATAGVTPAVVNGTQLTSVTYAGGAGYVIDWTTGAFFNGRKIRGRTFIVPAVGVFSSDGTISSTAQTTAQNAANALVATAGVSLGIWAKKFTDTAPPVQVAGSLAPVTGVLVPDRSAQLRTRRS